MTQGRSNVHSAVRRIFSLLVLCLVVGLVLAFFGTTPRTIFSDVLGTIERVASLALDAATWAVPYIVLGAIVVVPIAVIGWLMRAVRRG
jgi:hypothetical protein